MLSTVPGPKTLVIVDAPSKRLRLQGLLDNMSQHRARVISVGLRHVEGLPVLSAQQNHFMRKALTDEVTSVWIATDNNEAGHARANVFLRALSPLCADPGSAIIRRLKLHALDTHELKTGIRHLGPFDPRSHWRMLSRRTWDRWIGETGASQGQTWGRVFSPIVKLLTDVGDAPTVIRVSCPRPHGPAWCGELIVNSRDQIAIQGLRDALESSLVTHRDKLDDPSDTEAMLCNVPNGFDALRIARVALGSEGQIKDAQAILDDLYCAGTISDYRTTGHALPTHAIARLNRKAADLRLSLNPGRYMSNQDDDWGVYLTVHGHAQLMSNVSPDLLDPTTRVLRALCVHLIAGAAASHRYVVKLPLDIEPDHPAWDLGHSSITLYSPARPHCRFLDRDVLSDEVIVDRVADDVWVFEALADSGLCMPNNVAYHIEKLIEREMIVGGRVTEFAHDHLRQVPEDISNPRRARQRELILDAVEEAGEFGEVLDALIATLPNSKHALQMFASRTQTTDDYASGTESA